MKQVKEISSLALSGQKSVSWKMLLQSVVIGLLLDIQWKRLNQSQYVTTQHDPAVQGQWWAYMSKFVLLKVLPWKNERISTFKLATLAFFISIRFTLEFVFKSALLWCTVHFAQDILYPMLMPGWLNLKRPSNLLVVLPWIIVWNPFGCYILSINQQCFLSSTCYRILVCIYDDCILEELE